MTKSDGVGFWMKPLGDLLIVRQTKQKRRKSAIIEEAASRDMPWEGEVVVMSPEAAKVTGLEVGETVLFSRHAGQEGVTPLGFDDTYVMLHADEILAVLDTQAIAAAEEAHRTQELEAARKRLAERSGKLDGAGLGGPGAVEALLKGIDTPR